MNKPGFFPPFLGSACLLFALFSLAACGTLEVSQVEPVATLGSVTPGEAVPERSTPLSVETNDASDAFEEDSRDQVLAWRGTIHTVPGSDPGHDYFKPWHLNIWPKYGPAVGITGDDPSINAEIERLRDTDVKATLWGRLTCDVGDYGACQLLVMRITASDGGPSFLPDSVESWEGNVGALPGQPGSEGEMLYFVLPGRVPILYGISSEDPAIQLELERLKDSGRTIRIWGELRSRAQPVTGSLIIVDKLEVIGDA